MGRIKSHSNAFRLVAIIAISTSFSGCAGIIKEKDRTRPLLLRAESATVDLLKSEVTNLASISSLRAKMDLKFEDNSFAELGVAEKYRTADGELIVQRPANISLKIRAPIAVTTIEIAQMTSDGEKFRVAILSDGGSGKNRRFVLGTNSTDYSPLKREVESTDGQDKELIAQVNAFADVRPQHFTEALLVSPIDEKKNIYVRSTVFVDEEDLTSPKKSPIRRVLRSYYLLDEISLDGGKNQMTRRFWFDRVGKIRLARQQIFDGAGEIEADILYGLEGRLVSGDESYRMPLRIDVTRPKEKYMLRLSYQSPESVSIGRTYRSDLFLLQNEKNLPVIDLDERLKSLKTNR